MRLFLMNNGLVAERVDAQVLGCGRKGVGSNPTQATGWMVQHRVTSHEKRQVVGSSPTPPTLYLMEGSSVGRAVKNTLSVYFSGLYAPVPALSSKQAYRNWN